MLKVIMIRHGKTHGNLLGRYIGRTDEPLLPEEEEDLKKYAFAPVDRVFSSPRIRCVRTAEILFPEQEIVQMPEFAECDFGEFENKNYQELSDNPDYQKWIDSGGTLQFPGGESMMSFQQRCLSGMDQAVRLALENQWEEIALVVHGGTIMSILGAWGFPRQDYFDWHVDNGEGYRVRFSPEAYARGNRELVVDGRIVRGAVQEK
jgi:alpha-ribazole phosphatase